VPGDSAATAQLNQQVGAAISGLNQAVTNVLTVRASVGSRESEISALQTSGNALDTIYRQQLSNLQDLNTTQAISTLTQQQTSLTAAMQSFQKISGLSLFNYM
jgi:flagellar hook-associated protein 3 FlgL